MRGLTIRRGLRGLRLPALLASLQLSGCSLASWGMDGPMSFFNPKGELAAIQLDVLMIALWVCVAIFAITGSLYFYTLFRFRSRPGDEDRVPEQLHGNTALEIGLIGVFVVLLAIITVPNVRALFVMEDIPSREDADLTVEVWGYQWWWGFEYPGHEVRTANEMHIPVGKKIRVELYSDNVIHSFWVPKIAGKLDVIPNQVNVMWIQADEAGEYWGQCAELCGASHANMRFKLIAHEPDDFKAWVEANRGPARPVTTEANAEAVARGEQAFLQSACIGCHRVSGTHSVGLSGPDLSHFGSRTLLGSGMLENNHENLVDWIMRPQEIKPGNIMPPVVADRDTAEAIASYLLSLK